MTVRQRDFVEKIWWPVARPRLVAAGFWKIEHRVDLGARKSAIAARCPGERVGGEIADFERISRIELPDAILSMESVVAVSPMPST
jgi:hypothetical protein